MRRLLFIYTQINSTYFIFLLTHAYLIPMKLYETKSIEKLCRIYDRLEKMWDSENFVKLLAEILVFAFLTSLLLIELNRLEIISWSFLPTNHFRSIEMAFTLLLFFEVIALVFSLVQSVSKSMEIQLQILSLILLRDAFKLFGEFPEDYTWHLIQDKVMFMFIEAFGALAIFAIIILIRKFDKHNSICKNIDMQKSFVSMKKLIAIVLLFVFVLMISLDIFYFFTEKNTFNFFHFFFTILIFNDILLVFISLRYSNSYRILFRNSGYALATIVMRLVIQVNPPYNVILGVSASIFVLCLVIAYNHIPLPYKKE